MTLAVFKTLLTQPPNIKCAVLLFQLNNYGNVINI